MHYEIATFTLPFGTAARASEAVAAASRAPEAQGELLALWTSDIGTLNQLIVLRGFADAASLFHERERVLASADPLGCGASLAVDMRLEAFEGFGALPPARPSAQSGVKGPVYEIRSYGIKPGCVQPLRDLWRDHLAPRHAVSPCVAVMLALDGRPRFTNIWAYADLNARAKARADAVAQGIWPPKGGPALLTTDMASTIALPTAQSPMQ
mgnify:FL=1|jgi:hypothetical protein